MTIRALVVAAVAISLPAGAEPKVRLDTVASGLAIPWAMVFLDSSRAVVSERAAGRLSLVDLQSGAIRPLDGSPDDVWVEANAGMLDVVMHPDHADNGWIYYSYTAGSEALNTTVVERARLDGARLIDRERIFEVLPWYHNSIVYGCRLAFDGPYLFLTTGDRWDLRHLAQSPGTHLGKVLRLYHDGSVPENNPWAGQPGAMPAVWSLGNRNPQGLAVHPETGELWSHEHGPQGGDEVNIIRRGANYGWPLIGYGKEYSGEAVGDGLTEMEGMQQPRHYWVPSIAPSDMLFYTGHAVPEWRGSLFIGALAGRHLNRLVIVGDRVEREERLFSDPGFRVRMVDQGPDGMLYIGTDAGDIHRLVPAAESAPELSSRDAR